MGRAVELASLGPHLDGVCLPHVDTRNRETQALGVMARMGKVLPELKDPNFYTELAIFVKEELGRRGIKPLAPDTDLTFETWLDNTNYPAWRKEELKTVEQEIFKLDETVQLCGGGEKYKHFGVKLFTKDECYVDFKHARGIYARSDAAKIFFGPAVKAIEQVVYSHELGFKEFIKHVPVRERAKYIDQELNVEGNVYVATDYSSYEAHFNYDLMESCEFVLYDHMLSNVPGGTKLLGVMRDTWQGQNRIGNSKLLARVLACRMSGEMNTSLGNGFSNLMLMLFVCSKLGVRANGVVEGDDGLFSFPAGSSPRDEDFRSLGCDIKLVTHEKLSTASFCGLVFDEDDLEVITDPRDVIASLGWCSKRYAFSNKKTQLALLRSKALSCLHQYPACPMISEFARTLLKLTRSYDITKVLNSRNTSWWERNKLVEAVKMTTIELTEPRVIGFGTRCLVEELYGISIEDQQTFEQLMKDKNDLLPIEFSPLYEVCPGSWKAYFDRFVIESTSMEPIQVFPWANHSMVRCKDFIV